MTILGLPTIPGFATLNWRLEQNIATLADPIARNAQRVVRPNERWRCTLTCPPLQDEEAEIFAAWLDEASRGDRWVYLSPPQRRLVGGMTAPELISNGAFQSSTAGWSADGATLSVNARRLRVVNAAAASGAGRQEVTIADTGKPHVLLADRRRGKVTASRIQLRNASDVAEVNQAFTTEGRAALLWTPADAGSDVRLMVDTSVSGDSYMFHNISLARCLQVAGAGQSGRRLNVDGGPLSTTGALKAGAFVCVISGTHHQLFRLTEDLDTDGSGAGTLVLNHPLRAAPADDAAVILRNPFARFILSEESNASDVRGPNLHGFSIELIEDVTQ